ncbi:PREDICTED: calumenin-A-like [Branchiostoma belcheri]|uniref:Calumenin-A-like n=1 Tax=Branchiostoma belcheri TaxID=7741 RepID=A0A6P5A904_BRABE|nr:PREDICTED: calumenin-A-like [Branchiostoma belcheri]
MEGIMTVPYMLVAVLLLTTSAVANRKAVISKEVWTRLDADGDGLVTREELTSFTVGERTRDMRVDMEKQWKSHGLSADEKLTFERYAKKVYPDEFSHAHSPRRKQQEQRRFHLCDVNQDGGLDKDEFMTFLWAEEFPRMHDIVILETMEDMDKDGDGVLSYLEFTDDEEGMEDGPEAKKTFHEYDADADGELSRAEVKLWVLGATFDAGKDDEDSVNIVLTKLDTDRDGKLSWSEIEADPEVIEEQLMYEEDNETLHDEF